MKLSHKRIEVTAETELSNLLDEAVSEPLILERDGELYLLERADHLAYVLDRERVLDILEATVGKNPDSDVDAAIAALHEARRTGSLPPDRPSSALFRLERDEESIEYEPDPELVRRTLAATAGSWADLDIDAIIADIYEARREGSRPPDRP